MYLHVSIYNMTGIIICILHHMGNNVFVGLYNIYVCIRVYTTVCIEGITQVNCTIVCIEIV